MILEVRDITEETQARERLQAADRRKDEFSGLGLTLVKGLVELHGGSAACRSARRETLLPGNAGAILIALGTAVRTIFVACGAAHTTHSTVYIMQ